MKVWRTSSIARIAGGVALAAIVGLSNHVPAVQAPTGSPGAGGDYIHVDYAKKKLLCEPRGIASTTPLVEQWQMPAGGLTYHVNTASFPFGLLGPSDDQTLAAIASAASAWTSAGAPAISFGGTTSNGSNSNDGINSISFGATQLGSVGMATVRVSNGLVQEADIVLDALSLWAANLTAATGCDGALGKFDLQAVMTHEFGHWVGAKHPQDDTLGGSKWRSMFSDIAPGELYKRTLTAGDIASIPGASTSNTFSGTVTRAGDDDG